MVICSCSNIVLHYEWIIHFTLPIRLIVTRISNSYWWLDNDGKQDQYHREKTQSLSTKRDKKQHAAPVVKSSGQIRYIGRFQQSHFELSQRAVDRALEFHGEIKRYGNHWPDGSIYFEPWLGQTMSLEFVCLAPTWQTSDIKVSTRTG